MTNIEFADYPRVTVGPENPIRVERDETAELYCEVTIPINSYQSTLFINPIPVTFSSTLHCDLNPSYHRWTASRQSKRFVGCETEGSSRPSSGTSYQEPTSRMRDPTSAVLTTVLDRSVQTKLSRNGAARKLEYARFARSEIPENSLSPHLSCHLSGL